MKQATFTLLGFLMLLLIGEHNHRKEVVRITPFTEVEVTMCRDDMVVFNGKHTKPIIRKPTL